MTDPSHTDILEAVKDNSARLDSLETAAAEARGAMKFGRWFLWAILAIGGAIISIVEVLKHVKS